MRACRFLDPRVTRCPTFNETYPRTWPAWLRRPAAIRWPVDPDRCRPATRPAWSDAAAGLRRSDPELRRRLALGLCDERRQARHRRNAAGLRLERCARLDGVAGHRAGRSAASLILVAGLRCTSSRIAGWRAPPSCRRGPAVRWRLTVVAIACLLANARYGISMSEWFKRLPGFRRTPAGIERTVLRRLPKAWVYGSLLLMLRRCSSAGRTGGLDSGGTSTAHDVDIWVVALHLLHWTPCSRWPSAPSSS